jgi:hypothetical protein
MFKRASYLIASLLCGALPTAMAGLSSFPGLGDPTFSEADMQAAFQQGRLTGRVEVAAECLADPRECGCADGLSPCGVTSSSTLANAQYGETEPNDHIVAADPLIPEVIYWGQSRDLNDQDWYYITTDEPNQRLDLVFLVPDRVLADTSRLSQGWLVQVLDAGGNIYAQFATRFALDDTTTANKNESKEITYPLFLGRVGTYYVKVLPQIGDSADTPVTDLNSLSILYWPYNIAAFLSYSGLDAAPPDVNFHDVEIEPNNNLGSATMLSIGVSMYGLLRQTGDGGSINVDPVTGAINFKQTDVDYYKFFSEGNEQVQLTWCAREACAEGVYWFVEVMKADGTPIISFNTDRAETVHFGLQDRGVYYMQVNFQRKTEAKCLEYENDELECLIEDTACFKDTNNQYSDSGCSTVSNPVKKVEDDGNGGKEIHTTFDGPARTPFWTQQAEDTFCTSPILSPATGCSADGTFPEVVPVNVLSGDALYRKFQYQVVCTQFDRKCLEYEPVNAADEEGNPIGLSYEYNFGVWLTPILPLNDGTPGFDVFNERPSFYNQR